jgi:sirohydrochlorin ferrochelatase
MGCFSEVLVAALAGGDEPAKVLREAKASTVVVVPMMMCAGWIAQQVLPPLQAASQGRQTIILCEPIGMHPALAALMQRRAEEHLANLELSPHEVTLLLIAHGTLRNPASATTTEAHAAAIRASGRFRQVVSAYLDQPPGIAEALAPLPSPVVAIGCFAAPGHHATHDVETGLANRAGNGVSYLGPIGEDEAVPGLVRQIVEDRVAASRHCTLPDVSAEAGPRSRPYLA